MPNLCAAKSSKYSRMLENPIDNLYLRKAIKARKLYGFAFFGCGADIKTSGLSGKD